MNTNACIQTFGILSIRFMLISGDMHTIHVKEDLRHRDKILLDGNLAAFKTESLITCAHRCSMSASCMSIFYQSETNQCVLHNFLGVYIVSQQVNMTISKGWKYYEKTEGFSRKVKCLASGFLYDSTVDVCYHIKTEIIDFDVINQQCTTMNSNLIKITSQEKQNWITGILATNLENFVSIQGNNDNNINEYQFDDGTPMTYFNWNVAKSQPNDGDSKYIFMNREYNYQWHDGPKIYSDTNYQCLMVCEM